MKLEILPAIDIKDGNCVRLLKGDFATAEKVAEDPVLTAQGFEKSGATLLHMVDLDGAKDAVPRNREVFLRVARSTSLKIEVGGGNPEHGYGGLLPVKRNRAGDTGFGGD